MQVINDLEQWASLRKSLDSSKKIGAVLTMGNLHQGHTSLIQRCQQENDLTIVTIFINPTQFNNPEDFTRYPKTLEADVALLTKLNVDYCLHPLADALYPDNFTYQILETQLSAIMEGRARPGHFTGMLTVVLKLLMLIRPHQAYFGEKDYQQLLLIQGMANAYFIDCKIIGCPTIRESSQLACSSRNNRLNPQQRHLADKFAEIFHHGASCEIITQQLSQLGIKIDYIEEHFGRRFAAVFIDDIRLIDNYQIG